MSSAANYTAERVAVDGLEVIRLNDAAHKTTVSIVPALGNNSYEMTVNGKPVFWSPYKSLAEFKAKPQFLGNPFLAPWANRLDGDEFYANGKRYRLNPELHNFRRDPNNQPIHGLLAYSDNWKVTEVKATERGAEVTSRLEFWRDPDLMAQFPFAHNLQMTYRLSEGTLEVETVIENLSTERMPVSVAYHPYFQINDAPRDEWSTHLPAREHVMLSEKLTPTGSRQPNLYKDPQPLAGTKLDDVFANLIRDTQGRAEFWVQGKRERISVVYGPKYHVAVVYAPPGRDFICFEPMSGVTNAFNLHQRGQYPELQTIAPGQSWRESFWIRTSGY